MSRGSAWCDGLNRVHWENEHLEKCIHSQVAADLERGDVLISAATERGRSLVANRSFREGDVVTSCPALWFDAVNHWRSFLQQDESRQEFVENTVFLTRVRTSDGASVPVWAVLCGAAQYVQHYGGIKARPNARLEFLPSQGFNTPALRIVATSRGKNGISRGSQAEYYYLLCSCS